MILSRSGVGIWAMIEAAIGVASSDYGEEFRRRRDGIVESLYAPAGQLCQLCGGGSNSIDDQDHRFYNRSNKIDYSSDDVDHKDNNYDSNTKNKVDDDRSNKKLNPDFGKAALTPESNHSDGDDEDDVDPYGGLFDDDEHTKLLNIKEQLEDLDQVPPPCIIFSPFVLWDFSF